MMDQPAEAPQQDLARTSTERDSQSVTSRPSQRRSVTFDERSANLFPRTGRSLEGRQMHSESVSPRRRPQNSYSDDSDSEIRPIASSGDNRNYNTASASGREPHRDGEPPITKPVRRPSRLRSPSPPAPWYRQVAEKYGTIELDNKGATARDHLALERTFLAWLRTSLAFASIGIAITQLFRLNTTIASGSGGSGSQRLEYSPYIGHTIPAPDPAFDVATPFIQEDQSVLALLTSPHANAIPANAAQHLRQIGKPLGATFLGVAILILFIGFHRYFESQHWIIRGKFPASRGSVAIVGLMTGALIVACLIVVLAVAGGSFEKK